MQILETIIPVFLLIGIGYFLKHKGILTDAGIASIKQLAVNVFLPVTAFNVLINGTFTKQSALLMVMMVIILFASWGIGHVFKPLFAENIRGYIPLTVTTFEGGMFGWALVSILVGDKNLFAIIPMDITNGIFCFTFMATMLKILAGATLSKKETAISIITNPLIIADLLGFIGCAFSLGSRISSSSFAGVYNKCITYLTVPLSPLILICIGAGLSFDKETILVGLKAALCRLATVLVIVGISIFVFYQITPMSPVLLASLIVYYAVPTSFLLPMYSNDGEVIKFTSSALSIEIVLSLIVYSVVSVLMSLGVFGAVN